MSYYRQFRREALRGKTLTGPPQILACIVRLSLGEQGLSHGALTAYGTIIPPSTARRTRTNCGSRGTRGQGLSATPISCRSSELCRRFNEGRCRLAACRFSHACRGAHPAIACHQSHQWPPAPSLRAWPLH